MANELATIAAPVAAGPAATATAGGIPTATAGLVATAAADPSAAAAAGPGHLWQIDVVRLLTFTAVIAVHSLAFTQVPSNAVAGGFMLLLQYGREVFFAITGFVLVYSTAGRRVEARAFWRKRFPAVAVPYLAWTVIYEAFSTARTGRAFSWVTLGRDVVYGGAEYHLYFLLVTMQLYLVWPLLVRFVRATSDRAAAVLVAAGAVNLAWFGLLQYVPDPGGPWSWLWAHSYEILPTYTVYVLAGCYAAVHRARIDALVRAHGRRFLAAAAGGAAVAVGAYVWQLGWLPPRSADAVLQPAMFATSAAAAVALYVAGIRWAAGPRRLSRAVVVGSEISFGVYLAHPLVLQLLLDHGLGNGQQAVPSPLATVLGIAGALLGAAAIALIAIRTPLATVLTGRRRRRPGRAAVAPPRDLVTHRSLSSQRHPTDLSSLRGTK